MSHLAALVDAEPRLGSSDPLITDVTHDSRQVAAGSLFVALSGTSFDGHEFVRAAMGAGAVGACVEKPLHLGPEMLVGDTRSVLGILAAEVHGNPSHELKLIGVTGTNGKTTVTHFLHSMFGHAGERAGLIGTINTRIGDRRVDSILTTPEASELQRLLREMVDEGVTRVAMEVSSHALELSRVVGARFDVAAFTNLSQDHLDFHGDMESYRRAKERLFFEYDVRARVVNVDDPVGRALADRLPDVVRVGSGGAVRYEVIGMNVDGPTVEFTTDWGSAIRQVPILGGFNIANAAVALACALASGLSFDAAVEGLAHMRAVPGRFETIRVPGEPTVVVDYAHTPAGIEAAIATARTMCTGKVIALAGAGGDRDRAKRPLMGKALANADVAIVTTDNPRSEDPAVIAGEVSSGVGRAHEVLIDRREAISAALAMASENDVVLVLGRGHEPTQDRGRGEKVPFNDAAVVRELMGTHGHGEDLT